MSNGVDFQVIPQADALGRIKCDLEFRPADASHAHTLSPAQIEDSNRNGFVRRFRACSIDQIADIPGSFDRLLQKTSAAAGNNSSLSTAHMNFGGVHDILTNPIIVDYVSDLIEDSVVAWGAHVFRNMPVDGRAVAWHQDAGYLPLSPSHAVTVWLAIDDADLENGCMKFIAGSHNFRHLTFRQSGPEEHNVLDQTVEKQSPSGRSWSTISWPAKPPTTTACCFTDPIPTSLAAAADSLSATPMPSSGPP